MSRQFQAVFVPADKGYSMSFWRNDLAARDALAQAVAISKSQAVIEFNMDGTIITANQNFLDALGYRLRGNPGQASFDVRDARASVTAPNTARSGPTSTAANTRPANTSGSPRAAARSGSRPPTIRSWISGNAAEGDQVRHRHHRAENPQHGRCRQDRGDRPRAGGDRVQSRRHHHHRQREFPRRGRLLARRNPGQASLHVRGAGRARKRAPIANSGPASIAANSSPPNTSGIGKGGKEIWILASYNPILDDAGKPFKVVKFASDVSEQKLKTANFAGQIEAIGKSQAVIEFNMDGTDPRSPTRISSTRSATRCREIQGKHHSMFVAPQSARAPPIANSGPTSTAANSSPANISGSARAARRSGSRPPTTRSAISTASRTRW